MSEPLPASALAPDAPIHHLLSLKHNPAIKDMTPDQLRTFIGKIRTLATSAPTLSAKLAYDGQKIKPTRAKSLKQKLLDEI